MDWLNYHHLLYFWVVAREGTIARACDQLHLTQPSISKQLHQRRQYHVQPVGRLDAVRERFYAISVERKLKHPAVKAITEAAQSTLFQ